jgi:uncharacterized protein (TIGR02271 family)
MATGTLDKTVAVGVFQNRADAQACVNELKRSGFRDDEIGMVSRDHRGTTDADDVGDTKVEEGAAIGAAAGAGVGALWAIGIAAGLLPAIGPVIAGGLFASILASAAGAAAVGGLVGALIGLGIPEEEAEFYESEVKAGRTIVTVKAGNRHAMAHDIIERHHGFKHRDTAAMARSQSTAPPAMTAKPTFEERYSAKPACDVPPGQKTSTDATTVDLKKEELHARKQAEQVGEVRVRKDVVTEHKKMDVPVTREEVVIERQPVAGGRTTTTDLKPGEEVRIPVKEEHVHLEKTAHVTEQVKVGKRKVKDTEHVSGDVRHEEIRVEKEGTPRVEGDDEIRRNPK